MDIKIRIEGLESVRQKLAKIPRGFEWSLKEAIRHALGRTRTEIDRSLRSRYSVRQASVLRSIGRPVTSGLWGVIHAQGARLRPADFTGVQVDSESGVSIPWVRGQMARYPIAFRHGDAAHPILQRVGKERYPIRGIAAPISVPEAMGQKTVEPMIEKQIEKDFYSELTRLMDFILTTGSVPKSRFSR